MTKQGMTQEDLWQHYLNNNPHWQEKGARLTAAGLKKLFDQTWEQGRRVGHHQAMGNALANEFGDFSELFGNR